MNDNPKKLIMAISLMDKKKFKAYAVYDQEVLIVQKIVPITGFFKRWRDGLIQEVQDRKAKGFHILVEERTEFISPYATPFSFEAINTVEDRVNYDVAFDWYFALYNMDAIVFPPEANRFKLKRQLADILRDERGRTKYDIHWEAFDRGGYKIVLLLVMAAVEGNLSSQYLKEVFGAIEPESEKYDPLRSFRAITVGLDRAKAKRIFDREDKILEKIHREFGSATEGDGL